MAIKILDVGCGTKGYSGKAGEEVTHADIQKIPGVDVVCDLSKFPWKFKSNSYDKVVASHFLEHVANFDGTLEELYRILKPNGNLEVTVPHWSSLLAHYEYHLRFFMGSSFIDLDKEFTAHGMKNRARFVILKRKFVYPHGRIFHPIFKLFEIFANRFPQFEDYYSHFPIHPIELKFILKAVK